MYRQSALLAGLAGLLAACSGEACETNILEEETSPDGAYVVAIIERACDESAVGTVEGVDHAFVKAVVMHTADEDGYGDDPLANALHIVDGDWPIAIRWIDNGWFVIASDNPPDRLIKWSPSYAGGPIRYE